jgi:hypothetical protein
VASRRELLFGVRMNSSRPEGGDDGGDESNLRRFAVAVVVVFRGLRLGGAGLASHGSVRGIWTFFAVGRASEGDALSGKCFAWRGVEHDMCQVKVNVLVLCCNSLKDIYQHISHGI